MHKDAFEELSTNHESFREHLIKLEQNNNPNNHNLSFFSLLLLSGLATLKQSTNNHNNHNKKKKSKLQKRISTLYFDTESPSDSLSILYKTNAGSSLV